MEISIDESGTFAVKGASENSWCTIAAYACPISEKRKYQNLLKTLKRKENTKSSDEIKLGQISEKNYFQFLIDLNGLNGTLFSIAIDMSNSINVFFCRSWYLLLCAAIPKFFKEFQMEN